MIFSHNVKNNILVHHGRSCAANDYDVVCLCFLSQFYFFCSSILSEEKIKRFVKSETQHRNGTFLYTNSLAKYGNELLKVKTLYGIRGLSVRPLMHLYVSE